MQKRLVPHTDIEVSRLGLGTSTWGFGSEEDSVAQLLAFADAGGTLVETANVYGRGESERILGRAVAAHLNRDDIVIATKAGLVPGSKPVTVDCSKERMLSELRTSLRSLRVDHVDLWLVHTWDRRTPIEETLDAIDTAVAAGMVRAAGTCNYSGWQTAHAATIQQVRGATALSVVEVEYSLVQRGVEREVLPVAEELGIGLLPWAPLGRGVLTGKYLDGVSESRQNSRFYKWYVRGYAEDSTRTRVVQEVAACARELGRTAVEVSLAWVRDRQGVCAPLVGARTVTQLAESLTSESVQLPVEIVQRLDEVSAIPFGYPERGLPA